jgi:hypothetical protein
VVFIRSHSKEQPGKEEIFMSEAAEAHTRTQEAARDKPEKVVYCAVSADGDLRLGSREQQKDGVRAMRQAHTDLGLLGHTSWLINENDFCWTELHPEILVELAESDECIGIHDHLDTHYLEDKPADKIFEFLSLSRGRIHDFYQRLGLDVPIAVHRNGCAHQGREIYRALELLEYSVLSDVWPGMKWYSRMVPAEHPLQPWKSLENSEDPNSIFTDNSQVPLSAAPWRHDADNWLDVNSHSGRFLQAPLTCLPWVDQKRVQTAVENSGARVFLVIDTHPYNLQNPETGGVSAELVKTYCNSLEWIRDTYKAIFIRIDQIPRLNTIGPENKT